MESPETENKITLVNFSQAIAALKEGKRVARMGWNGKGLFIFMQIPAEIPMDVVPKMQSLPDSVKAEFERRLAKENESDERNPAFDAIRYKNQLAMVYPDNNIYGWVASPSDVLEEDWCILD